MSRWLVVLVFCFVFPYDNRKKNFNILILNNKLKRNWTDKPGERLPAHPPQNARWRLPPNYVSRRAAVPRLPEATGNRTTAGCARALCAAVPRKWRQCGRAQWRAVGVELAGPRAVGGCGPASRAVGHLSPLLPCPRERGEPPRTAHPPAGCAHGLSGRDLPSEVAAQQRVLTQPGGELGGQSGAGAVWLGPWTGPRLPGCCCAAVLSWDRCCVTVRGLARVGGSACFGLRSYASVALKNKLKEQVPAPCAVKPFLLSCACYRWNVFCMLNSTLDCLIAAHSELHKK